tara:strand:+ start:2613 stop:3806 length:1194 start_codon:yes stop_codon:yes gene_type:complete
MAKKRSNHEGNIRFVKSKNLYEGRLTVKGKTKSVYSKSRVEVADKLDELRNEMKLTGRLITKDFTLSELAQRWIEARSVRWSNTNTYDHYWKPFELHLLPLIANKRISEINDPIYLDDLFNTIMVKKGITNSMINRSYNSLSNCLEWAVGRNLISVNKCKGGNKGYFDLPKHNRKPKPQLDLEEVQDLKFAMNSDKYSNLFKVSLATGMRISEVLGLSEGDINLLDKEVTVRHQLKRDKDKSWYLDKTKSKNVRILPISKEVSDLLLDQLGVMETIAKDLATDNLPMGNSIKCNCCSRNKSRLIFTSDVGTPIDKDNLRARHWKKIVQASGLDIKLTIHDLRHIFASTSLVMGFDVISVSKYLGHADPSITLQVYAEYIKPPRQREMAEKMGSLLIK